MVIHAIIVPITISSFQVLVRSSDNPKQGPKNRLWRTFKIWPPGGGIEQMSQIHLNWTAITSTELLFVVEGLKWRGGGLEPDRIMTLH